MGLKHNSQEVKKHHDSLSTITLNPPVQPLPDWPHALAQRDTNAEFEAIESLIHAKAVPFIINKQVTAPPKLVNKIKDMSRLDWSLHVRRHLRHVRELIFLGGDIDDVDESLSSSSLSPTLDTKAKKLSYKPLEHLLQTEGQPIPKGEYRRRDCLNRQMALGKSQIREDVID
jgi:hypothetical protein